MRPGEKVPVDGCWCRRQRRDESMITGESIGPQAGGRCGRRRHREWHGQFRDARRKIGADTLLARIVKLVGEAQRSRAPIQRLADRVSAFVPADRHCRGDVDGWATVGPSRDWRTHW